MSYRHTLRQSEFESVTSTHQFSNIFRLGDPHLENGLLQRFFAASDQLTFEARPFIKFGSDRCYPLYTAIVTIKGVGSVPDYCLEVTFKEDGQGSYYREPFRWLILDNEEKGLTKMLDINLIDLENR